jgi:hypothetical protein
MMELLDENRRNRGEAVEPDEPDADGLGLDDEPDSPTAKAMGHPASVEFENGEAESTGANPTDDGAHGSHVEGDAGDDSSEMRR